MKCENCGAEFDAKESKCPYCGALNLSGAEEQYMNHLEEMNRSFAEMADDSQEEYRYTFLSQGKKIGKILAMILVISLVFAGIFFFIEKASPYDDDYFAGQEKKRLLWKNEYSKVLETMCQEGKTAEIDTYCEETIGLSADTIEEMKEAAKAPDGDSYDYEQLCTFLKAELKVYD